MSRKKKLKKGVESLEKQIEIHEEKLKKAVEDGNIELEGYYQKEISNLKDYKKKKEDILEKQ